MTRSVFSIVPADSAWPRAFSAECARLKPVFAACQIEHIGSTSVRGLDAKPVIDILVGVRRLADVDAPTIAALEVLGYRYVPEFEAAIPERRYFYRSDGDQHSHHLHVVAIHGTFWRDHLLFRDYLRTQPHEAAAYARLKHALAPQFNDTAAYSAAKGPFILDAMGRARQWRRDQQVRLATPRLVLRPWQDCDLAGLSATYADPEVMRLFPAMLTPAESAARLQRFRDHWATHGFGIWAVERGEDGVWIGLLGLAVPDFDAPFAPCVEIAWTLRQDAWRQGYASEGATAALLWGFSQLGLEAIFAFTTPANVASRGVMRRIGMEHVPHGDFDHPRLPAGHALRRHVLYRADRPNMTR